MPETIFPWQTTQWQQVWSAHQHGRLPHALLFSGVVGMGKKQFAQTLAHSLLCLNPNTEGSACQQCRSCYLRRAQSHPDLLMIEPEEIGQAIKIDQIRAVIAFVNETPQQGGYRIIIIDPATAMNINAANALLKSLEEPTPNCLFILISDKSERLLPTIKSRCQEIQFTKPETQMALDWLRSTGKVKQEHLDLVLQLAHGAPLKAIALEETDFLTVRQELYQGLLALSQRQMDPLQFAVQWQESNLFMILNLLQDWLCDLMRSKITAGEGKLINMDFQRMLTELSRKIPMQHLLLYVDCVQKTYLRVLESSSLNRLLVLEELFIQWVRVN